jgi:hypothetical protein
MVAAIKRKSQSFDGVRGCQPARQFFVVEADQTQVARTSLSAPTRIGLVHPHSRIEAVIWAALRLAGVGEGLLEFRIGLDELDSGEIRPRRLGYVLALRLAPVDSIW